jgi:NADPH-dependent 2,4-dienoyl-CoA reductase/sulfur reductase-like enzyme
MMMHTMRFGPLLWVATALLGLVESTRDTAYPVCIVGAGPAGLIAASKLEIQGKKVVVFEKQDEVGGNSQAIYGK